MRIRFYYQWAMFQFRRLLIRLGFLDHLADKAAQPCPPPEEGREEVRADIFVSHLRKKSTIGQEVYVWIYDEDHIQEFYESLVTAALNPDLSLTRREAIALLDCAHEKHRRIAESQENSFCDGR